MVITSRNTINSVFFLILDFISVGCLFIMVGAEFLGMIILIVYVGAVAVERQIQVKGPDAEAFTDYVITRDATKISPMRARYVILCNQYGGVLNDPILLRISKDEFWFSLSDSDIGMYLQGVNADGRFDCTIEEIDEIGRAHV